MKLTWRKFLAPRSMAVVGVSRREDDYVNHFVRTMLDYGFKGRLYLVNPREREILGFKCYPSVLDVEDEVDLAFIAVPGEAVSKVLEDCGRKGVKAVIVFSSDSDYLSPTGDRGIGRAIADAVAKWGFKVIGPNCLGIYRPSQGMCFAHGFPREPGDVAFLAQSGGHAAAMGWLGASIGLRFSAIVSYGNAVDVDLPELVEAFSEDPETKVVAAYVEGVKDGRRLVKALMKASQRMPMVVWKGGVSKAGAEAVATHTLALAGSWRVWEAALRKTGAVVTWGLEDTAYTCLTLSLRPQLKGRRLATVSISGGEGVSTADALSHAKLELARLSERTLEALKKLVPRYGSSIKNPVDIQLAALEPEALRGVVEALLEDPGVDGVLVSQSMEWPIYYRGRGRFMELVEALRQARREVGGALFVAMQPRLHYEAFKEAQAKLLEAASPCTPPSSRQLGASLSWHRSIP
ncbi:MAG: hypothetical protein DRJ97_06710 [Thermoprotei archaeon]|nr:MAG: hypothetical protein DRJ97_06710 [Thermoprotei archaeon]